MEEKETLMYKEDKFEIKLDDGYLPAIASNGNDLKFFKLEKTEVKKEFVLKLTKYDGTYPVKSKYNNDIHESFVKLKKEENITGCVSNKLLGICKSEEVIYDVSDNLLHETYENIQDYSDDDFDQLQIQGDLSENTQSKEKRIKKRKIVNQNRIFNCAQCDYKTQTRQNFVQHSHLHFTYKKCKRKIIECAHCNYSTNRKSTLVKHLSTHGFHGAESTEAYQCSSCKTKFKNRYNLIRHLRKVKVSRKCRPFKCSICSAAYPSNYELNRHSLVHGKEFPFKCAICDFATTRRSILGQHLLRHERNSLNTGGKTRLKKHHYMKYDHLETEGKKGEEQSKGACEDKPKTAQVEDKYPFKCDTCQYGTSKRSLLKYHIVRRHTREPIFGCLSCNYSTFRLEELHKHKRSNKHDIFSCEHCEYTCFQYLQIQKHMKTHFHE